ncbi:FMN-binding glutamate synthase family protein [Caldicoprobacter algeriensis]|uniref:FMN-binding glutamate synthase family protein n=1 Tax=Caldicoprobacter algeriensis TaxID=699281 RepID=UPI002079CE4A|nr:FMN-binding glutamate synthase family protein [Caldicoprobacter algeriensis]MCM8901551.1 FMN-binding glutamate synthase family protein [Caldicoprobacter algeriensis]
MSFSKPGRSLATKTRLRTPNDFSPFSGMCSVCLEGCTGLCEVGLSSIRGREVLYPQPFGKITAAAEKDYPIDFSHFNIMGTAVGAVGIEADPDKAIFPAVKLETEIGAGDNKIKLKMPIVFPAQGSTNVAKENWEGYAGGAALCGVIVTVGENVCAMDPNAEIVNGRVKRSPDMEARINAFRKYYNGYGTIAVQANVEDTNLGVLEYAIEKLGVEAVEIKWGQGAKDIGGEVKLSSLERALQLKERGYIVLPDPTDPEVQKAFKNGAFTEFERHSRLGMVDEESFHARVNQLRNAGAKYIFLKTGAYRPADLARAVKYASDARIDLLTVDGAGGGTGMSPWRMMNEWGIPTVYIEALLYNYLKRLADKGAYIPAVAIAGGFTLEDHIFKGLALGAPYVKLVGMGRSPMTAAMVGKTIARMIQEGKLPEDLKKHGQSVEQIFYGAIKLKEQYGEEAFNNMSPAAIAVYTYMDRVMGGLQQLMAGARKFDVKYITRDDIAALTPEAAKITGIKYIMDVDAEEVDKILG